MKKKEKQWFWLVDRGALPWIAPMVISHQVVAADEQTEELAPFR